MARIRTGKTPPAKGKSATAPPTTHAGSKALAAPAKKTAAKPQVKAIAAKKQIAPTKPVAAKRSAAAQQQADLASSRKQARLRATSVAKPAGSGKTAGKILAPTARAKTAKAAPPPRAAVASQAARPAKAAVKTVAVKTAAPRRAASRTPVSTPATRRARVLTPARKTAVPPKIGVTAPQTFTVSHLDQSDFKTDGLRPYARYRDLAIAAATNGLCQAHVIRFVPPCTDEVRKRHLHKADLQLVYVLQGWMKNEFEGHGEQMMSTGSCWIQPSGIRHTVLDYSADCEVLEIIIPANFETQELT